MVSSSREKVEQAGRSRQNLERLGPEGEGGGTPKRGRERNGQRGRTGRKSKRRKSLKK
jgi:hypothetical protein